MEISKKKQFDKRRKFWKNKILKNKEYFDKDILTNLMREFLKKWKILEQGKILINGGYFEK